MAEEKFQSIYGDAESEFEIEDVSDETLSISKEEIEEKIQEETPEETAPEEEPAPVEEETPKEEEPAEEPSPVEEPHEEESPEEEEQPSEPEEEPEIEGVSFEEHSVHHYDEDEEPEEEEPVEDDKVSIISYILHAILFTIPIIGTVMMLIYIISDKKNVHLRHFAQIWLITLVVIAIGIHAAIIILGI